MKPVLLSLAVLVSLIVAVFVGRWLRRLLPEHHFSSDTKDTVKLAMGLVGTMAALLLGLLISSAKDSYDAERSQVVQMAAKISFLNRILVIYGPEAADARARFHSAVEDGIAHLWPEEKHRQAQLEPNREIGNSVYFAIAGLASKNELQQKLKTMGERRHRCGPGASITRRPGPKFDFSAHASRRGQLAHLYLCQFQPSRSRQQYCHGRPHHFLARGFGRDLPDPGIKPAI